MKESKLVSELITYKETILLHLKKKVAKKWDLLHNFPIKGFFFNQVYDFFKIDLFERVSNHKSIMI